MQEGTLIRWLKAEGSNVDLGEPVAEIETDKAVVEFESYASGVLRKILVDEGSTVPVGEAIAVVGEAVAAPEPEAVAAVEADEPAPEAAAAEDDAALEAAAEEEAGLGEEPSAAIPLGAASEPTAVEEPVAAEPEPAAPAAPPPPAVRVLATPIARQMARDAGIDLAAVSGSGPGGRIVREDVSAAIASMRAAESEPPPEEPAAEPAPEVAEPVAEEAPAETPEAVASDEDEAVADAADEAEDEEAVSEEEPQAADQAEPAAETSDDEEGEDEEEPESEVAVETPVAVAADDEDEGEADEEPAPEAVVTGEIIVSVPDEGEIEEEPEPVAAEEADDEEAPEPVAAEAPEADDGLLPLSRARRQIARVTARSKSEKPHFYVNVDIDMTAAMALRGEINSALSSEGVRVTVNDMIIAASVIALKRYPKFNAYYEDGGIRLNGEVNVGVAMALEEGLIMPAIVGAGGMSLKRIAQATKDLSERARSGSLTAQEYSGGTFAISNMGMMGVTGFVAIIQPPQTAVLAIGSVQKRPVVTDDDQIAVRQMMTATLSADHRIVDGAEGAVFINEIKSLLENPLSVIL